MREREREREREQVLCGCLRMCSDARPVHEVEFVILSRSRRIQRRTGSFLLTVLLDDPGA